MKTRFDKLATLRVAHAYYTASPCVDFGFVIPAESARVLARGKILPRVREGMLHLLVEAVEGGAAMVPVPGAILRVGLRLDNPALHNITAPAPPVAPQIWLYRNTDDPTALGAPEIRTLAPSVFSHALAQVNRPVTVTARDAAGAPVGEVITVSAADGRTAVSFDLRGVPPGPVSIHEDYGSLGAVRTPYYLHPELAAQAVSLVVELTVAEAFYTSPPAFVLPLSARAETLRYYLVVENHGPVDYAKLNVTDAGSAADIGFPITFSRTDDAAPPAFPLPANARGLLFESTAPVPRRERARRKIQLNRNGDTLFEHLPQPGPDRADGNFILHISK